MYFLGNCSIVSRYGYEMLPTPGANAKVINVKKDH